MSSREVTVSLTALTLTILTVATVSYGQMPACLASGLQSVPDCVELQQVSSNSLVSDK